MNLKKYLFIAGLWVAGGQVMAQQDIPRVTPFSGVNDYRTWSIGVWGAGSGGVSALGANEFRSFGFDQVGLMYGVSIKKQIYHGFGLQAEFMRGNVKGAVKANQRQVMMIPMSNNSVASFIDGFKTKIDWATSLSGVFTLGTINWLNHQATVLPYVSAGGGYMGFKSNLIGGDEKEIPVPKGDNPDNGLDHQSFYIPVGLGAKFNVATGINIDLSYHLNFVDDSYFNGLDFGKSDKFSELRLGVAFALGNKSKPQLAVVNAPAQLAMDLYERNQDLKRQLDQSNQENQQALSGLQRQLQDAKKDTDNDGVADIFDKCPNTDDGVRVDGAGCPLPQPKQIIKQEKVVVTQEDRKVVDEAIKNLEFDLSKATIRPISFPSLDRVAELLVNKHFSLKLAGHTDNTGSNSLNMRLSKERAESVKSYLVSKGANASRIEAVGYGSSQPIATNSTAEGRQKNRRVEFTLY